MGRVLVFDFDGTLVDSMGQFAEIAVELFHSHFGLSLEKGKKLYLKTSGLPFNEQIETIFPQHKKNVEVVEAFEQRKQEIMFEQMLFPEIKDVFACLKAAGHHLVISSSSIQEMIEKYCLRHELDVDLVLGYAEGFGKGQAHFNYIRQYFGCAPGELLFIGDSLQDYQKATENGINFIARSGTFSNDKLTKAGVKYVIKDLGELCKLLNNFF